MSSRWIHAGLSAALIATGCAKAPPLHSAAPVVIDHKLPANQAYVRTMRVLSTLMWDFDVYDDASGVIDSKWGYSGFEDLGLCLFWTSTVERRMRVRVIVEETRCEIRPETTRARPAYYMGSVLPPGPPGLTETEKVLVDRLVTSLRASLTAE